MKNKWRHIRDNFQKHIQQGKSGDAAPCKKKKYVYADALNFLLNSMEKRKTSGNVADNEEVSEDTRYHEDDVDVEEHAENVSSNEPGTITRPTRILRSGNQQRGQSKLTQFQAELLHKLDATSKDHEDADKAFLMSLLPDYRKLNDDEKLDFKFTTLQFFRNIRQKQNDSQNLQGGYYTHSFNPPTTLLPTTPYQAPLLMQGPHPYATPSQIHHSLSPSPSPNNILQSSASSISLASNNELL